jgi:hypothetical protein
MTGRQAVDTSRAPCSCSCSCHGASPSSMARTLALGCSGLVDTAVERPGPTATQHELPSPSGGYGWKQGSASLENCAVQ